MGRKAVDMTGKRIGRLTVIERAGYSKKREIIWKCKCDCGNEVNAIGSELRRGSYKSCGCYAKTRLRKHGKRGTRLFRIWAHMRDRCNRKNASDYKWYGARGIKVCEEWQEFQPFYDWAVRHGYRDNLTIDRIETSRDYSPDNCKWSTPTEQANNRRSNRHVLIDGEKYTVAEAARVYGLAYHVVQNRLYKGLTGKRLVETVSRRDSI